MSRLARLQLPAFGLLVGLLSGLVLGLASGLVLAHDGELHRDAAAAAGSAPAGLERPQRLADGSLRVVKPMQHQLGLRTWPWSSAQPVAELRLVGEARPSPEAALDLVAPERGRLEAAEGGWPQAGQSVQAGRVLAWLHPQLSQQAIADRRARIAVLEQQLVIIDTNVERQEMQSAANVAAGAGRATDNIWFEKYVAERDALRANLNLLRQSLSDRLPLRATVSGRVLAVSAAAGSIVEVGQPLLRLADPDAVQLMAIHQQAGLAARIAGASTAAGQALRLRDEQPLADGSGWRLRFDLVGGAGRDYGQALVAGQLADIRLSLKPGAGRLAVPASACVRGSDGRGTVWLHRDAERYEPKTVAACRDEGLPAEALALAEGDRIVVEGAALLSLYR